MNTLLAVVDTNVMTKTLNAILGAFETGGEIGTIGAGILGTLIMIEITWAGIMFALNGGGGDEFFSMFLKKVVHVGMFAFITLNFPTIAMEIRDFFSEAGASMGGFNPGIMLDPTAIVDHGINATDHIFNAGLEGDGEGFFGGANPFVALADRLLMGSVALAALFMYFVIALQAFMAILEFQVVAMFGVIMIPWGVNKHTAFIAERYFGAIVASGVKLMVTATLIGIVEPILKGLTISEEPVFYEIISIFFGVATIAYIVVRIPAMAGGMMAGSASLSINDAFGSAQAGTAVAASVAAPAVGAVIAGGQSAVQAASKLKG